MPYHRCAARGLTSYDAPGHVAASMCPVCSASLCDAAQVDVAPGSLVVTELVNAVLHTGATP